MTRFLAWACAALACLPMWTAAQQVVTGTQVVPRLVFHKLNAQQLSRLKGKLYWDADTQALLGPALLQLLGDRWDRFDASFQTTGPLVYNQGMLSGRGRTAEVLAAFEFQPGGLVVASLMEQGRCTEFGPVNPGYLCHRLAR